MADCAHAVRDARAGYPLLHRAARMFTVAWGLRCGERIDRVRGLQSLQRRRDAGCRVEG
jgi:hypothetical protein